MHGEVYSTETEMVIIYSQIDLKEGSESGWSRLHCD